MDFSCLDVARAAGLEELERRGDERLFECPRHDDSHPSLLINPHKYEENGGVYMCGPCGVSGTAWALAAFLAGKSPSDKRGVC